MSLQGKVDQVTFSFAPMQPKPSLASNLQADGGNVLLKDQSSSIAARHCKLHMGVTHSETRSGWERQSRDGTTTRGWVTPMRGSVPLLAKRGTTPFCVPNNSVTLPQHEAWPSVRERAGTEGIVLPSSPGLALGVFVVHPTVALTSTCH